MMRVFNFQNDVYTLFTRKLHKYKRNFRKDLKKDVNISALV